jgi:hypothetical protein
MIVKQTLRACSLNLHAQQVPRKHRILTSERKEYEFFTLNAKGELVPSVKVKKKKIKENRAIPVTGRGGL